MLTIFGVSDDCICKKMHTYDDCICKKISSGIYALKRIKEYVDKKKHSFLCTML